MGNLTKEKFGLCMPVNAPVFSMPIYMKDIEAFWVDYETETEAVNAFLPEGLEPVEPAEATIIILNVKTFGGLGPYKEAALNVKCKFNGQVKRFIAQQFVDTDAALIAGREAYGCPKKLGHIDIVQENEILLGVVERPKNKRICTLSVVLEKPVENLETEIKMPTVNLKVIPSVDKEERFSSAELIEYVGVKTNTRLWQCKGDLTFDSPSAFDPWHKIPVRRIKGAYYSTFDYMMPYGKVIKKY